MSKDKIYIFDTTLRDGEQSPGATLNIEEKVAIAQQLYMLGVDVCEAGFPIASPGDFKAIQQIVKILQKNNTIKKIRKTLVKKAIKMMEELSNDEESYNKFYKEFHKNIKWGINDDEPNREKLSKLVRYYTTTSGESQTSLTQYVENMKEDQKHIYYIFLMFFLLSQ